MENKTCCGRRREFDLIREMEQIPRRDDDVLRQRAANRLTQQVPLSAHVVLSCQAEITNSTAEVRINHDAIPDFESFYTFAQRRYYS
jgi:hypothetical protein